MLVKLYNKCRPEVAGDVISGVAVEWVGVDVHIKFCGSRSCGLHGSSLVTYILRDNTVVLCSCPTGCEVRPAAMNIVHGLTSQPRFYIV